MKQTDPTLSVAAIPVTDPDQTSPFLLGKDAPRFEPHAVFGDYEILEEIARGGMGVVYKARHGKLNRIVALKMTLVSDLASDKDAQRFKAEAEAAAKLDHPNIVPIYEVGEIDGRHFFSMAFIEGRTLAQEIVADPLPPRQAAIYVKQVADAVSYAHEHGVIHRDLKPGNIMLDAAGQARVMDFGLAKRTDADSSLTQAGQVMGTPSYMPPEQAEGKNEHVGPLADVYSLGATLYCLVTGRPPFQSANVVETLKQVVEREPVAPHFLNPAVDRDLDTICLKCLQKRPEKRYASATALAEDLQRYLDRRPILARPVGDVEKLVRWCRRNPQMAASLAGIAGIFVTAFALVSWSYMRADDARKEEANQRRAADQARDDAQRKEKAERWERYRANISAAASAMQMNNVTAARRSLDDAPVEHRGWEWRHFDIQTDGARSVLRGHKNQVKMVAFSPDGRRVASSGWDDTVRIWDTATGAEQWAFRNEGGCAAIAFSSDGTRVGSGSNRGATVWDLTTGAKTIVRPNQEDGITVLPFSAAGICLPEGRASMARTLRFVDMATGRDIARSVHEGETNDIAVSPDGRRIATAGNDYRMHLWDARSGARLATLDLRSLGFLVPSLCLSPDGTRVATGSHYPDNKVRLWDWARAEPVAVMPGHGNTVMSVALSPDGTRIASGSMDQTVRLWDGATGNPIATLRGHSGWVYQVAFSPDGRRLVSASQDRSLRLWDAATGNLLAVLRGHGGDVLGGAFSPDGRLLVSGSRDGTVRLWDVDQLTRRGALRGHSSFVYDAAFSPDGTRVASAAWDGTVRLWDATTGLQTGLLPHEHTIVTSLAFGPRGDRLAVLAHDDAVHWWDLTGNKRVRKLTVPISSPFSPRVALSPKGDLVATGGKDGLVRVWDAATGQPVAVLSGHDRSGHDRAVRDVAFDPTGGRLASAGNDRTVHVSDVMKKETLHVLRGHSSYVYTVAYSGDGKWIASGSVDGTVRLWDAATFEEVAVLHHAGNVYKVAFSPDGTRLATACSDNTIRLWDIATRQEVAELRGHETYVHSVAWSPDGTQLVSGSGDFTVRVWDTLSAQKRAESKQAAGK